MKNAKRKTQNVGGEKHRFSSPFVRLLSTVFRFKKFSVSKSFPFLVIFLSFLTACNQLEKTRPEPFYGAAAPPAQKEFRWSNGGRLPKTFDPALAAAAPETDVARALFEGLTDTDARSLKTVPAIAVDWSSSDDNRVWTFRLRGNAQWSNGERITASDFVRSWKRLAALGSARVPHFDLLVNIVGIEAAKTNDNPIENPPELDFLSQKNSNGNLPAPIFRRDDAQAKPDASRQTEDAKPEAQTAVAANDSEASGGGRENAKKDESKIKPTVKNETVFGAVAIDNFTLRVSLRRADKDFPALVAHPVFRPVFGDGKYFDAAKLNADIVTSGAFRVADVSASEGVTLERSESFWNKNQIQLERVRFVPAGNAERALAAYRAGEIDAVTNADFEPLASKLLTPFDDFRRTAHGALNFYEFNRNRAPFRDKRVREALTIAVERERLTQDEMDGASVPALGFLPFADEKILSFSQNVERAKNLFAAAGFAGGEDFPVVRLVVNRNNVQQKIARAVAKMWKQNLNVETEIIIKENSEIEAARAAGDFDVLRRGAIFATTDEAMNMSAIFGDEYGSPKTITGTSAANKTGEEVKKSGASDSQTIGASAEKTGDVSAAAARNQTDENSDHASSETPRENASQSLRPATEADAMKEFAAVPLYFPTAYSLVKPYVRGFDANTLDAPSLKDVSIDNDWKANH